MSNGFATTKQTCEFPASKATFPSWKRMPRDHDWPRFIQLQKNREDVIGQFCREALADRSFPSDPTVILRYLAVHNAPADTLAAARKTIAEYRAWFNSALEAETRQIADVNISRAMALRESLHESTKRREREYKRDLDS